MFYTNYIYALHTDLQFFFIVIEFQKLTLIGMREGTFHPLFFLDQNLSAEFLS